ncbi:PIN domain-containing protein [Methylobacterium oryzae]|uniref:ATPase involved in DNA repair n=1 Tax=Methylobacterium oryzae CBMB20 TaxID=693986 RepID=A0A089NNV1_9HYPH|nr:PIN domain-containing protein [Methylobacterium oryzae]AIQ89591.1 putative ATPase involved in DNA repair [Methylobacterium oryzae CBMB20]
MNDKIKTSTRGVNSTDPKEFETHIVFLDTQVYRKFHFNPENKLLQILISLMVERKIDLYITDITLKEIERQISEIFIGVNQTFKRANKDLNYWLKRANLEENLVNTEELADTLPQRAFARFTEAFRFNIDGRVITAATINAAEIFANYFERRPPFEKHGSKEFPDAFVVQSLDNWCDQNNAQMNVVSADESFRKAADATENLITYENLDGLLQSFATLENRNLLKHAQKFLTTTIDYTDLKTKLEESLNDGVLVYWGDLTDGEANECKIVGEVEITDYSILSYGRHLSVLLNLKAELCVNVSYDDMSFATYDREDDKYYGVESENTDIDCSINVNCYVRFDDLTGKIEDFELLDTQVRVREDPDF